MSAHKYIRVYCNEVKVRSTGNEKWYRNYVLEEDLGYDVDNHRSYGIDDYCNDNVCIYNNVPIHEVNDTREILDLVNSGINECIRVSSLGLYILMDEMIRMIPDTIMKDLVLDDALLLPQKVMFRVEFVRSSKVQKIKTVIGEYKIGFYLEHVVLSGNIRVLILRNEYEPDRILGFSRIGAIPNKLKLLWEQRL